MHLMYIIQHVSKSQNAELPLDTPATSTWELLSNMHVQHSMPTNSETSNVTGLCTGGPGQKANFTTTHISLQHAAVLKSCHILLNQQACWG